MPSSPTPPHQGYISEGLSQGPSYSLEIYAKHTDTVLYLLSRTSYNLVLVISPGSHMSITSSLDSKMMVVSNPHHTQTRVNKKKPSTASDDLMKQAVQEMCLHEEKNKQLLAEKKEDKESLKTKREKRSPMTLWSLPQSLPPQNLRAMIRNMTRTCKTLT
jgi:hypothetical protein